jgi:hypothetical protein
MSYFVQISRIFGNHSFRWDDDAADANRFGDERADGVRALR